MSSPVSVCNQALGELGETLLTSLDEGTSPALLCNEHYPAARDMTLDLHPWNWATRRVRLALSADTPAFGYDYQYLLPTDPYCLTVRQVDPAGTPWEVELDALGHRVLLSDETGVGIVYTARVEDLNLWSPLALQVLVKVLASKLAKPLTGQSSVEELKWKEALALLPEAQHRDGKEGAPRQLTAPSTLVVVRRHRA